MTKLVILEYPDPRLRTRAEAVTAVDDAVRQLADDMLETMYGANGVGLAATQVDVHRRVIVLDASDSRDQPLVLINPELIGTSGKAVSEEGCLSLPGIFDKLSRAAEIRVRALNRHGEPFELDAQGLLAVCIQHEIDHLDGRVFVDYLSELKRQLIRKRLEKERKHAGGNEPRPAAVARRSRLKASGTSTPAI
jgi:peptide deformylase